MNLGISIANLLRRYPAVEVPGIGVFRRNRRPASYDSEKSLFIPPSDDIELVGETPGAFPVTAYLTAQQPLEEQEATIQVERAVADVMERISRNGEALLDGLGYLVADGASFMFRPFHVDGLAAAPVAAPLPEAVDEPLPDAADAAGEAITVAPEHEVEAVPEPEVVPETEVVSEAEVVSEVEVVPETEVISATEVESEVQVAPAQAEEVVEYEVVNGPEVTVSEVEVGEESVKRSTTPWVMGGIVAALLVAAIVVWQLQPAWLGIRTGEQPAAAEVPVPLSSGETEADAGLAAQDSSMIDIAVTGLATTGPADGVPADTVPVAEVPPAKPSVAYEIIVGSFATMQQAHKFVAEMKAKGYENLEAIDSRMPGNRKKVSWGSYATEEEAYKELSRVQRTFEPGAWIAKVVQE